MARHRYDFTRPIVTAIRDLDPCRYLPVGCDALTAVGWLRRENEFEIGFVPVK